MTTEKTIALTRWTFVGKVMSLLFNIPSRLVVTFLPRGKRLLISWLQSPSAVILEPMKRKFVTIFIVSPFICFKDKCTKYTSSSCNSIAEKRTTQAKSGLKDQRDISPKKTYGCLIKTWKNTQNYLLLDKCKSKSTMRCHLMSVRISSVQLTGATVSRYPMSKGREAPARWKGEIAFRIKLQTHQRCSEGSNIHGALQDPETPPRLRQNCVWVSPAEVHVSSGLLQGQGLWVQ